MKIRCRDSSEGFIDHKRGTDRFPWFTMGNFYEMTNIKRTGKHCFEADVKGIGHVTDLLVSCFELPLNKV
jgi:hypothetical protein